MMESQQQLDYYRIAKAIAFIQEHYKAQPKLEEVAQEVHLSPFHFQRLFKEWAGVSPKQFLQFVSVSHAKKVLESQQPISGAAFETGLSSTGRLHDLFVKLEGMTPGAYKNGGEKLKINYSFAESPFGNLIIASTEKGVCHMAFYETEAAALAALKALFPKASYEQKLDLIQQNALFIFTQDWRKLDQIKLHLKGTAFQIKVWEALLKIPTGQLKTYGQIAQQIGQPQAARAVGTAIGNNPIAFLIPCHRVIQSSGMIGQYRWGSVRKTALIGWEAAQTQA